TGLSHSLLPDKCTTFCCTLSLPLLSLSLSPLLAHAHRLTEAHRTQQICQILRIQLLLKLKLLYLLPVKPSKRIGTNV
ncbi:hypothetical protein SKAU_G00131320, partial [Synaphobranchus kaupii]